MKPLICFITLLTVVCSGCDPFHTELGEKDVYYYFDTDKKGNTPSPLKNDSLKVMTWNIKFGGGRIDFFFDCHGNRVIMDSSEVITNLERVIGFINATQSDILMVQEIDINSKRSAYIDQVNRILSKTRFRYAVYAPQWRADLIPSNGLGRMNSGNAIFSVTPLFNAKRVGLPLIEEQNFLVRYFYLRRHLLDVCTVIGGDTIHLLNTHLSAYSTDGTKKRQIEIVYHYLDSLDKAGEQFIIGGDFNTLPPGTHKVKGFPDSACQGEFEADDYSGEEEWMRPFYNRFTPAIPLSPYESNNQPFFTHSTSAHHFWNRKLDYILTNLKLLPNSSVTYQSTLPAGIQPMKLSDHCAISTVIIFQ